ncbi:prepilin peptidase [Xanthobacter sp. KR7-65]|uniref:A24 family peptidase n=1 Tax=Xanthobacter sp. KR7-65 TaxID=3156612 RepID=UPI0032B3B6BC
MDGAVSGTVGSGVAGAIQLLLLGLYPALLCACIGTDLARRIIPNAIVAALILAFAMVAAMAPLPDLSLRILVAMAVTGLGFSLFAENIIGAGDAKLAGALMLWLDPLQVPLFILCAGLIGAALSVASAASGRMAGMMGERSAFARQASLPYGVALAGAGLLLHPFSSLMQG